MGHSKMETNIPNIHFQVLNICFREDIALEIGRSFDPWQSTPARRELLALSSESLWYLPRKSANPKQSMYGIFPYIYHKNQPNVGKYTIHGWYGNEGPIRLKAWCFFVRENSWLVVTLPETNSSPLKNRLETTGQFTFQPFVFRD